MIALLVLLLASPPPADGVDLLLPDGPKAIRLRVEVRYEETSPKAWAAFLDKLFDHFDRDGDSFLSRKETARIFPLPLPDGSEVRMDFARMDRNRDGKVGRDEFQAFYWTMGFKPVVASVRPNGMQNPDLQWVEHQRLGTALFRHLNRRGDGRLTRADLETARSLLKRLDENEDEVLSASELLALEPPGAAKVEPSLVKGEFITPGMQPDARLVLALGQSDSRPLLDTGHKSIRALSESGTRLVLAVPDGQATIASARDVRDGFRAAKGFYLAQFKAAAGNKPALSRSDLESDPSLEALLAMFPAADRNGDGKLTLAELASFLELVEFGIGCQIVVTIEDRGRNLFVLLDLNGDGALDLGELNRAAQTCDRRVQFPLTPTNVPRQYFISVNRGSLGPTFGPVPLPSISKPKAVTTRSPSRGPKWFQAMDRTGDGFLSPEEFLGPPELFQKLDADGDGRISIEEAERAAGK